MINQAEALFNLGKWRRAERLLRALADAGLCADAEPATSGLLQLAWVLAQRDKPDEAAFVAEGADPERLPRAYRAEAFFTRALLSLKQGAPREALAHLDQATQNLVRTSSERNELFLRAWAETELGNSDAARALYKRGAEHRYQGQGADGLLRWGDLLLRLGLEADARVCWQLAMQRDPESEAAGLAGTRLMLAPVATGVGS